ncbi:hypothetical protein FX983_00561 [Pseudomonas frederiksbergensis]|uniref:Uncharacterized protein n=1 Tax=Pseudomonas frederiksbergensis TaxID=104087 RepID=A0A6L5BW61_9PSED|nr:hypothetical protein FX983_00561 [Pseudomonas frederiksbergensis]
MQIADQQDNNKFETALKPSRAGSLPQGNAIPCGSEPAREGAGRDNKSARPNLLPFSGALRCNETLAPLRSQ